MLTEERKQEIRRYVEAKLAERNQPQTQENELAAAIARKMEPKKEEKSISGFFNNVGTSAGEMLSGMVEALTNPVETVKGVGKLAGGALQKAGILSGDEYIPYADAIGKFYKDRYGGLDNIANTAYSDPVGFLADVASIPLTFAGGAGLAARGGLLGGQAGKIAQLGRKAAEIGNWANPLTMPSKVLSTTPAKAVLGFGEVSDLPPNFQRFAKVWLPGKALRKTREGAARKVASAGTYFQSRLAPDTRREIVDSLLRYNLSTNARGKEKNISALDGLGNVKNEILEKTGAGEQLVDTNELINNILYTTNKKSPVYSYLNSLDPTAAEEVLKRSIELEEKLPERMTLAELSKRATNRRRAGNFYDLKEGDYLSPQGAVDKALLDEVSALEGKFPELSSVNKEIKDRLKVLNLVQDPVVGGQAAQRMGRNAGELALTTGVRQVAAGIDTALQFAAPIAQAIGRNLWHLGNRGPGMLERFSHVYGPLYASRPVAKQNEKERRKKETQASREMRRQLAEQLRLLGY